MVYGTMGVTATRASCAVGLTPRITVCCDEGTRERVRGYAESKVFTAEEVSLYRRAVALVELVPDMPKLRCHELARAVGRVLGLEHEDGFYGFVDHTWLWTGPLDCTSPMVKHTRVGFPNILDVYSVGSLPMVRLVDCEHTSLPHIGWGYRPHKTRDDIDEGQVDQLVRLMQEEP